MGLGQVRVIVRVRLNRVTRTGLFLGLLGIGLGFENRAAYKKKGVTERLPASPTIASTSPSLTAAAAAQSREQKAC